MKSQQQLSILDADHYIYIKEIDYYQQIIDLECKTTLYAVYKDIEYSFTLYFSYCFWDKKWELDTKKADSLDFSDKFKTELVYLVDNFYPPIQKAYQTVMREIVSKIYKVIYKQEKEINYLMEEVIRFIDSPDEISTKAPEIVDGEYNIINSFLKNYTDCEAMVEHKDIKNLLPKFKEELSVLTDKLIDKTEKQVARDIFFHEEFEAIHRNL